LSARLEGDSGKNGEWRIALRVTERFCSEPEKKKRRTLRQHEWIAKRKLVQKEGTSPEPNKQEKKWKDFLSHRSRGREVDITEGRKEKKVEKPSIEDTKMRPKGYRH